MLKAVLQTEDMITIGDLHKETKTREMVNKCANRIFCLFLKEDCIMQYI